MLQSGLCTAFICFRAYQIIKFVFGLHTLYLTLTLCLVFNSDPVYGDVTDLCLTDESLKTNEVFALLECNGLFSPIRFIFSNEFKIAKFNSTEIIYTILFVYSNRRSKIPGTFIKAVQVESEAVHRWYHCNLWRNKP